MQVAVVIFSNERIIRMFKSNRLKALRYAYKRVS